MYQYEKIAFIIEQYLDGFIGQNAPVILTSLEVRKWKKVAALCQNSNYASVCKGMESVKHYGYIVVGGKRESTTYTVAYDVSLKKQ